MIGDIPKYYREEKVNFSDLRNFLNEPVALRMEKEFIRNSDRVLKYSRAEKIDYLLNVKPFSSKELIEYPSIREIINEFNLFNFLPLKIIDLTNVSGKDRTSQLFEDATFAIRRALKIRTSKGELLDVLSKVEMNYFFEALDENLISSGDLISKFRSQIDNLPERSTEIINGEIVKYKIDNVEALNALSIYHTYDEIDLKIRWSRTDFYNYKWDYRYYFGYLKGLYNKEDDLPPSNRLIDRYFLKLGLEHSKYYNHMIDLKKNIEENSIISVPDKILMLDSLGLLDYLKRKLELEKVNGNEIIGILSFLLSENPKTITRVLDNKDIEIPNVNDYKKVKNYNTVIATLNKLGVNEIAQKLEKQRNKLQNKK